jgi:MFS family permease
MALGSAALFFIPAAPALTYVLLFVLGLVLSVIFPLIISLAGIKYPEASGTVLGLVKLGIPIGGIVVPFLLSLFSRWWSFSGALLLFPALGVIGFVLLAAAGKRLRIA